MVTSIQKKLQMRFTVLKDVEIENLLTNEVKSEIMLVINQRSLDTPYLEWDWFSLGRLL